MSGLRPVSTGRMSVRSIAAPAMKAIVIEITIAPTIATPLVASFQVMKVENRAISPVAKLSTPVVRKISTSATATRL